MAIMEDDKMTLYDMLAKSRAVKGRDNLRTIWLVIISVLLLTLIKKPINFQDFILNIANKPLPIITEFPIGILLFIIAFIGLIGFWRKEI